MGFGFTRPSLSCEAVCSTKQYTGINDLYIYNALISVIWVNFFLLIDAFETGLSAQDCCNSVTHFRN